MSFFCASSRNVVSSSSSLDVELNTFDNEGSLGFRIVPDSFLHEIRSIDDLHEVVCTKHSCSTVATLQCGQTDRSMSLCDLCILCAFYVLL